MSLVALTNVRPDLYGTQITYTNGLCGFPRPPYHIFVTEKCSKFKLGTIPIRKKSSKEGIRPTEKDHMMQLTSAPDITSATKGTWENYNSFPFVPTHMRHVVSEIIF